MRWRERGLGGAPRFRRLGLGAGRPGIKVVFVGVFHENFEPVPERQPRVAVEIDVSVDLGRVPMRAGGDALIIDVDRP